LISVQSPLPEDFQKALNDCRAVVAPGL